MRTYPNAPTAIDVSCHRPRRSAFTLIELLTVMAIIGVLAALTLAVTGRVRKAARKAVSMSNERQIVQALILYDGENKRLPQLFSANWKAPFWNHRILPYMGVKINPENPADPFYTSGGPGGVMPKVFQDAGSPLTNALRGDYGALYHVTAGPIGGVNPSLSLSKLTTPAKTPLVATAQQLTADGTPIGAFFINNTPTPVVSTSSPEVADRYDGNCIIAFADGHVVSMQRATFYSQYLPFSNK